MTSSWPPASRRGEELTGLGERAWREVRGRRIGLIPQDPGVSLDPVEQIGAQVAEVLRVHRLASDGDAPARAVALLGRGTAAEQV
ncbi:hypothetical protein [Streptomyces sp. 11x1]|uniref:hypothetical protein n=1 Tax=Streptomyces sp. 11x1 TaxID=3038642 RepID=UPI00292E2974|nr:hypothetical protein [Streptomyces sp. 11x1]WNZ08155.1 hypothetical protein P8T65_11530 [Streptomyces sp. 11x1]